MTRRRPLPEDLPEGFLTQEFAALGLGPGRLRAQDLESGGHGIWHRAQK